jgi:hypothetical protein
LPYEKSEDIVKSWSKIIGSNYDTIKNTSEDQNFRIAAGDIVKYGKSAVKWKLVNSQDSMLSIDRTAPIDSLVIAYAYTEVMVDKPGIWNIALGGTMNRGGLLVNGMQVWEYSSTGKIIYDNGIPIFLKKGKNTLLLRIEQKRGRTHSSFNARFFSFQVGKFAQREKLFTISRNVNGTVLLSSELSDPVIENLVQDLNIEIINYRNETILKNYHDRGFIGKLNIKTTDYQPYTAQLNFKVKSGGIIHQEIPFFAGKRNEYILFAGNKTGYRIALDSSASTSEQWAAKELQHWLKEISGADFPIQTIDLKYKGPQIVIGYNELVKRQEGSTAPTDLDESFHYCNSGPDILIYGGKQRGTMYGVITFLENELGCRWYTPSVSVIPKRKELKFSWYNHSEKPGIRVRNDFYFEAFDPTWAARKKMNGRMDYRDQPGGSECYWNAHTFYQLMSPSEFFDKHPEYYSLINGVRTHERAQLCLSNPEVLKIITERIRKRMRESPEYLIYDVSQNDCLNPCQCD